MVDLLHINMLVCLKAIHYNVQHVSFQCVSLLVFNIILLVMLILSVHILINVKLTNLTGSRNSISPSIYYDG